MIGRSPARPVFRPGRVSGPPFVRRRAGDRLGRKSIEELLSEAPNDEIAAPVGHPVDPDDKTSRGQAAEVIVPFEKNHGCTLARCSYGGGRARRPTSHDQYVALTIDRQIACRLLPDPKIGARNAFVFPFEDIGRQKPFISLLCRKQDPASNCENR